MKISYFDIKFSTHFNYIKFGIGVHLGPVEYEIFSLDLSFLFFSFWFVINSEHIKDYNARVEKNKKKIKKKQDELREYIKSVKAERFFLNDKILNPPSQEAR